MFSKNAYMSSPSSHPRTSASVVGLNANDFFLHQYHHHHLHHHDMLSGHHFATALYNQDVGGLNLDPSAMAVHPCTAKAASSKKDRHSKINTAQGPRDRRVRLSIGVARKFFDLQEILGFDKPSKTLDWLLTKSETAINDVEQMREKASTDAAAKSYNSECEVDSSDLNQRLKGAAAAAAKVDSTSNLAKESRAKARARARERTREKMCIKKQLNETRSNNGGCDLSPPIQFMNNQLEFRKISSAAGSSSISTNNINVGFHQNYEAAAAAATANEDLIEESIVIKRKVKHPSMLGFQQNLIISSSNYGVPTPYNNAASENWDNICAILDQHKFINSTSNN